MHLERAREQWCVIVTQDNDFLRLHASGASHAGIAFAAREISIGNLIRGLMLIHQLLTPDEMVDHLEYL